VREFLMSAERALGLIAALQQRGVAACVAGGWAVDALLGRQTRPHSDLDIWVDAADAESLFAAFVDHGVDRLYPWPGDRPWNFVLHDGRSCRVDLHFYEPLGDGRLTYGGIAAPFVLTEADLDGRGTIVGTPVRCEAAEFALRTHSGYALRRTDRQDVAALCEHFGMGAPGAPR
jgi:lincosamide nucleotidyltransferase A/C/D/E